MGIGKREDYLSWDEYFMGVALLSAQRSKDPNTQVGACIVDPRNKTSLKPGSEAAFDVIAGPKETVLFTPIATATSVRDAFMTWVARHGGPHGGTL